MAWCQSYHILFVKANYQPHMAFKRWERKPPSNLNLNSHSNSKCGCLCSHLIWQHWWEFGGNFEFPTIWISKVICHSKRGSLNSTSWWEKMKRYHKSMWVGAFTKAGERVSVRRWAQRARRSKSGEINKAGKSVKRLLKQYGREFKLLIFK